MHDAAVWTIAGLTIALMLARPLRTSEWIWPVLGAALLVATRLLGGAAAAQAARDGLEVYAFLAGMLLLAEVARVYGIFEWATLRIVRAASGDSLRLFTWMFAISVAVTALLSNDGTILLLTPAAASLAQRAKLPAMPFAYAVAFVANAASFVLPISNPANLVVFARLPQLGVWLAVFAAPSVLAVACTYGVLRATAVRGLPRRYAAQGAADALAAEPKIALALVGVSLALVVLAAGVGWSVGYAALALGVLTAGVLAARDRSRAATVLREGPWQVIPLVAGLFVIVRALDTTGALNAARMLFQHASAMTPVLGRFYAGGAVMLGDAVINNLPAGVIVRYALSANGVAAHVAHAALVGIDLGPNLSMSGSLATLLWAMMLRRDGIEVNAWRFLVLGALVTVPSLALALLVLR